VPEPKMPPRKFFGASVFLGGHGINSKNSSQPTFRSPKKFHCIPVAAMAGDGKLLSNFFALAWQQLAGAGSAAFGPREVALIPRLYHRIGSAAVRDVYCVNCPSGQVPACPRPASVPHAWPGFCFV